MRNSKRESSPLKTLHTKGEQQLKSDHSFSRAVMAAIGYETLRIAKAALDEGLINTKDFDEIKTAFLRAQQIKAGLDAGFIRETDYQAVKRAFLNSLNLSVDPAAVAGRSPALALPTRSL